MSVVHTISGNLRVVKLHFGNFLMSKNRRIRIWTPSSYKKESKVPYRVIYMWDGQNLFDDATAYSGEWHVDEAIESKDLSQFQRSVVVGIDCSQDRLSEYLPRFSNIAIEDLAYKGEKSIDFLMNVVIPYVEKNYNISKKREDISIGGSSMGGLMSLAAGIYHPEKFSKIYAFSPSFTLFKYGLSESKEQPKGLNNDSAFKYVINQYKKKSMKNQFKIVFSSGGIGIEEECYEYLKKLRNKLIRSGWSANNLLLLHDQSLEHNEEQWSHFFPKAYKFLNK
ncbi:MAG: alpha/beta hydrolase-fold protein [Bacilli bacterium]